MHISSFIKEFLITSLISCVSLHSTKLESYQLPFLARALDKGCHKFASFSIMHCAIRDVGIKEFLSVCNKESFNTLEVLDLTDNRISENRTFFFF